MIIHIREEYPNPSQSSASPLSARPDDLSSSSLNRSVARPVLKVYRVFEFVDTQFCAAFFPEEMERFRSQLELQRQSAVAGTIQQSPQPVESTTIPRLNTEAGGELRLAKL